MSPTIQKAILPALGLGLCVAAWLAATRTPEEKVKTQSQSIAEGETTSRIGKLKTSRSSRPSAGPAADGIAVSDERLQKWLDEAAEDTPAALAKIININAMVERREVLDWVLSAWTTKDRGPALDWLKDNLRKMPDDSAEESIDLLIGPWAQEKPQEAKAWVEENIQPPWVNTGFQSIAQNWADSDPETFGKWILQQQSPPDLWAEQLIQIYIPTDPELAMEWCDHLSDSKLAAKTRQSVIQSWLINSPGDAAGYLRDHPEIRPEVRPEDEPTSR